MQPLVTGPKLLLSSQGIDVVELDAVLLIHCHRAVCVPDLDALRHEALELLDRRPSGLSALFVVDTEGMNLLDHELRDAYVDLSFELEPLLRAKAYVLRGAAEAWPDVETAIPTVHMLAGSRTPTEIFHDLPAALSWLALTDRGIAQPDLTAVRALLAGSHK